MFAPTAEGGFNCAGCHGDKGVGGARRLHDHRLRGRLRGQSVTWKAPALNTVLLRFSRDEVTLHPHLRPPVLADAGVGRRRRRPAERRSRSRTSSTTSQSIQLTPKQAQAEVKKELAKAMKEKDPTCVETCRPRRRQAAGEQVADFDATTVDTSSCPTHGRPRARRCSTSATTTASPAAPTPAAAATPRAGPTGRSRRTAAARSGHR